LGTSPFLKKYEISMIERLMIESTIVVKVMYIEK